jgi:beta-1,4-mannosyltransferase
MITTPCPPSTAWYGSITRERKEAENGSARPLRAADLVVLPYREILNSGSAILALSFARPVLVPAQGAMTELQRDMGREWVRTYPGELRPRTLADALHWARQTPRDPARLFPNMSWETIARQTLRAYLAIGK